MAGQNYCEDCGKVVKGKIVPKESLSLLKKKIDEDMRQLDKNISSSPLMSNNISSAINKAKHIAIMCEWFVEDLEKYKKQVRSAGKL